MPGTLVKELMASDPVCVEPSSNVQQAARKMRDQDIGNVIVTHDGEVLGIVTDRDIAVRAVAEGADPASLSISDICSSSVTTVSPDTDASEAAQIMREKAIRRLPVVENGRAVGIISIGDLAEELDQHSALATISEAPPNN